MQIEAMDYNWSIGGTDVLSNGNNVTTRKGVTQYWNCAQSPPELNTRELKLPTKV